jgi:hypothetical protein
MGVLRRGDGEPEAAVVSARIEPASSLVLLDEPHAIRPMHTNNKTVGAATPANPRYQLVDTARISTNQT